jgi:hypothetical protein
VLDAISKGAEWECYWNSVEDEDGNPIPGYGPPLGRDIEYCIANRIAIRLKDSPPQPAAHPINDGGQISPQMLDADGRVLMAPIGGMTLRDYFAAKAMVAYLSLDRTSASIAADIITPMDMAGGCYEWADLMIAARDGKGVAKPDTIQTLITERNALVTALEPFLLNYSQDQLEQLAASETGMGEIGPQDARRQLKARAAIGMVARGAES